MFIFEYYSFDPNGWVRHFVVGLVFCLIFRRYSLPVALFVAVGKEFHDGQFSFFAVCDVLFTIAPALISTASFKFKNPKTKKY